MTPSATTITPTRLQKTTVFSVVVVIAAAVAVLFLVNPVDAWFLPACQFHRLTGLHCPGCGMTRATHQLLHGHVLTALRMNAVFTLAIPLVAGIGLWRLAARPEQRPAWKPIYTWLIIGALIAFGILRNIPAHPFTLLSP
jgi:hypothetical protein